MKEKLTGMAIGAVGTVGVSVVNKVGETIGEKINDLVDGNQKKNEKTCLINNIIIGLSTILYCYLCVFFFKEPINIGTIISYIVIAIINTLLVYLNRKVKDKKKMTIVASIYAIISLIALVVACII